MIYKVSSVVHQDMCDEYDLEGMQSYRDNCTNAGFSVGSIEEKREDYGNMSFEIELTSLEDLSHFMEIVSRKIILHGTNITIYDGYME